MGDNGTFIFADSGINIAPNTEQLTEIALSSAQTAEYLCEMEPKVAMLSFSTKGSARHADADKMYDAARMAKKQRPDLCIDGELQLDAALVPEVTEIKAPGSEVAGKANVLIFPDLGAGNIGYKLVPVSYTHLQTVCLFSKPEWTFLSSSIVKEMLRYGQDIRGLVPAQIYDKIRAELHQ